MSVNSVCLGNTPEERSDTSKAYIDIFCRNDIIIFMKKITTYIKEHSTKFIIGLVSLGIIGLIIGLWPRHKDVAPVAEIPAPVAEVIAKPQPVYYKPVAKNTSVKLGYMDALKQYSATRIQLDAKCQATPFAMVIKGGATVMIDNRGNESRVVTLGTDKVTVPAYDYALITTAVTKVSEKALVDCGSQQNVAQVTIEP